MIVRAAGEGSTLQVLFRCPRQECQHAFIANYWQERNLHRGGYPEGIYRLRNTAPLSPKKPDIPAEVAAISPNYVEILTQSTHAEARRLDQIAGVGYRKSLEFLIKDYAIHKDPANAEDIKKIFLGTCIDKFIKDANVKACAARAAWLGNDETHYLRKWEAKDINDLKTLLRLTEAWILNELLTEKYLREMP
jgi:hypothetical protein